MLPFTATSELTGLDQAVAAAIRAVTEQALTQAAEELRHRLVLQFESEGTAYAPQPWLPRKARDKSLPRRPLLFHTGRLKRSFTHPDSPDHIEERTGPNEIILGSAVPYAAAHQCGTVRMPARPILTPEILSDL